MRKTAKPDHVTAKATDCEPMWEPLQKVLPEALVECFMAIYQTVTNEGPTIHAYKHIDTRRYLFLDDDGDPWCYTNGESHGYSATPLGDALEEAFCGWGDLHGYTPELGAVVADLIATARAEVAKEG